MIDSELKKELINLTLPEVKYIATCIIYLTRFLDLGESLEYDELVNHYINDGAVPLEIEILGDILLEISNCDTNYTISGVKDPRITYYASDKANITLEDNIKPNQDRQYYYEIIMFIIHILGREKDYIDRILDQYNNKDKEQLKKDIIFSSVLSLLRKGA